MEYPDWLNGLIIALATIALVGVTIYYARVTKKILKASEQMRLDAQKPRIAVYLGFKKEITETTSRAKYPAMYLYIENIGMGPAYDVHFDTHPDLKLFDNRSLGEIGFIARGIRYLPPRQKRKIRLAYQASQGTRPEHLMQEQLEITVTYKGIRNKECKRCFCLIFGEYESEYRQMVSELI